MERERDKERDVKEKIVSGKSDDQFGREAIKKGRDKIDTIKRKEYSQKR